MTTKRKIKGKILRSVKVGSKKKHKRIIAKRPILRKSRVAPYRAPLVKFAKRRITVLRKSREEVKGFSIEQTILMTKDEPKSAVAFVPEPWSKVTKYKKIKKEGYYGNY